MMLFLMTKQQQSLIAWWPRCSAAREWAHRRWWPWTRQKSPPGSSLWSRAGWRRWRQRPAGTRRQRTRSSRSPGTSAESTPSCLDKTRPLCESFTCCTSCLPPDGLTMTKGKIRPSRKNIPQRWIPIRTNDAIRSDCMKISLWTVGVALPGGSERVKSCQIWSWKWKPKEHHQLLACLHLLLLLCSNS